MISISMGPESEQAYLFPRTAVIKYLKLVAYNNRNVFSHSSGSWKSKIKVPAGLVSSDISFLGL